MEGSEWACTQAVTRAEEAEAQLQKAVARAQAAEEDAEAERGRAREFAKRLSSADTDVSDARRDRDRLSRELESAREAIVAHRQKLEAAQAASEEAWRVAEVSRRDAAKAEVEAEHLRREAARLRSEHALEGNEALASLERKLAAQGRLIEGLRKERDALVAAARASGGRAAEREGLGRGDGGGGDASWREARGVQTRTEDVGKARLEPRAPTLPAGLLERLRALQEVGQEVGRHAVARAV